MPAVTPVETFSPLDGKPFSHYPVEFKYATQPEKVIDPAKFVIDCSEYDLSRKIPSELKMRMELTFREVGLVLLTKTGLKSSEQMSALAQVVVKKPMLYKGGANSRDKIAGNVYDTGAPLVADLHYHHEMAYVLKSTQVLGFCCMDCPEDKGWTYVSDQVGLTEELLKRDLGQKLKEKGLCYVRCLTDKEAYPVEEEGIVYNHWQKSFGVETMEEAEREAEDKGLKVEWGRDPLGNGRYMITKFYVSAFEYCPITDKNIMFSSIADDAAWFDTWPGLKEVPPHDRPLKLLFGDDSEFSREEFQEWVELYAKYGVPIKWKTGDVALVCNWRWAHGRPSIHLKQGEKRKLGVLLGDTFDRVGHLDGKW